MLVWNEIAVEELKVVGADDPLTRTCEPLTNPFPFTVTLKVPMLTAGGPSDVMDGVGFSQVTVASPMTGGVPTVA